jgi:tRNA modification GTPase
MVDYENQTIIAQCTPKGSGAIALIRISGKDALNIATKISKLANKKQTISTVPSHTIHYGQIIAETKSIDLVMFFVMHGPRTFTGEDVVEVTCHNNPFIIEEIIALAIKHGARIAENGEFAKRSFLNNKIDLMQAEAINDLIHSNNQQTLKKSLSQLEGSLSNWIDEIEKVLVKCLAFSEASFEFLDEEEIEFKDKILNDVLKLEKKIQTLKANFSQQQQIKEGLRIALIGSVNAGKSSLFNALLKKNRAIVTSQAGTTRDSIEAGIYTKNHYFTLVDTAGIRKTDNVIEEEGIKRSFEEAEKADILLLVEDSSRKATTDELNFYKKIKEKFANKVIVIANKTDIKTTSSNNLQVSTKTGSGITELENQIQIKAEELMQQADSPFLLNQRQHKLVLNLEIKLQTIKSMLSGTVEYELLSIHLTDALQAISELSGKDISERGMDAVFKEFCVGK